MRTPPTNGSQRIWAARCAYAREVRRSSAVPRDPPPWAAVRRAVVGDDPAATAALGRKTCSGFGVHRTKAKANAWRITSRAVDSTFAVLAPCICLDSTRPTRLVQAGRLEAALPAHGQANAARTSKPMS